MKNNSQSLVTDTITDLANTEHVGKSPTQQDAMLPS